MYSGLTKCCTNSKSYCKRNKVVYSSFARRSSNNSALLLGAGWSGGGLLSLSTMICSLLKCGGTFGLRVWVCILEKSMLISATYNYNSNNGRFTSRPKRQQRQVQRRTSCWLKKRWRRQTSRRTPREQELEHQGWRVQRNSRPIQKGSTKLRKRFVPRLRF